MVCVMVEMATFFKRIYARSIVSSAPDPTAGHCQPWPPLEPPGHSQASLAQSLVGLLLLSPGSWCTQGLVCALQESVSPVLWKFCNEILLAFKVKLPGGSQSLCQIPRLGNLLWALECLQQWENFFDIIVLQFVGHWLGSCMVGLMETSSKRIYLCHMLRFPGLLQPEPLSTWQATADLCLHRRHSNTQRQV